MKRKYDYVLRNCKPDMTSYNNFVWPRKGPVEATDWKPNRECGNGLHGWLNGVGNSSLGYGEDSVWLVVRVPIGTCVDLYKKIKFQRGEVIFAGTREKAVALMQRYGAKYCMYGTATAGDMGTATAGDRGTAIAGDRGTAIAGDRGTATAGFSGTATAGDYGTATAGFRGTATAGDYGTATAGDGGTAIAGFMGTATAWFSGTATAGFRGTATAGDRGTATAGDYGTATAGDGGTAIAGDMGTATAGDRGTIFIKYWYHNKNKYRYKHGECGEDGIKPDTKYRLNKDHEFEEVPELDGKY